MKWKDIKIKRGMSEDREKNEELNNGAQEPDVETIAVDAGDDKLQRLEAELKEAKDAALRRTAELDNMRRRFQQEREQLIFEGNKRLISELLSTVDDLERTLQHAKPEEQSLAQGVELVYRNFLKSLERYGVKPIESVGKPFDFNAHDALLEEPSTEVEPGIVTKEVQKGYMLNDNVLRHAKVIVSKQPD